MFNRLIGQATIWALPVAAVGVLLTVLDKIAAPIRLLTAGSDPVEDEDELAEVVLGDAQDLRAALIGAGDTKDDAANVRFRKDSGRFRQVGGDGAGEAATILDYYLSLSPRRLVVLGEAGAGKTVLAVQLQVRLLEKRQPGRGEPVPVLISASTYNQEWGWDKWLAEHLVFRYALGRATASRLVSRRLIIPIIDGLDEMRTVQQGPDDPATALVGALNAWMRGTKHAPVVVTARSGQYQSLPKSVDRATHVELLPMPGDETAAYLRDQFADEADERMWRPVLAELEAHPDGKLASQLATPWRLTLALAAVRDGADPASLLPRQSDDYASALDQRLLGGYIAAAVRLPGMKQHYPQTAVKRWLTALAVDLETQGRSGGSPTDLRLDQWSVAAGGGPARFGHAAVSALPGLASLGYGIAADNSLFIGSSLLMLFTAAGGAMASLRAQRLRLRGIASKRGLRIIGSVLWQWLPFGILIWVANGFRFDARGLWGGIGGWLVTGTMMGLINGAADGSPKPVSPRQVIAADGRFRLAIGLIAVAVGEIPFAVATRYVSVGPGGQVLWALLGLTAALSGVISGYASAWTRYHVTVLLGALRGRTPLRLGEFLDWSHQVGLLRANGPAYQFRHRQLQDYLTSCPPDAG